MARSQDQSERSDQSISILLEEYRALYGLAVFRMASLERRVPLFGSVLALFAGSVSAIPEPTRFSVFYGVPTALIWLVRTTINHARSFEDVLRRIDEIECDVNARSDQQLLRFQSSHPSKGVTTGGRTGTETVAAVTVISLLMLIQCAWLFASLADRDPIELLCYLVFSVSVAAYLGWCVFSLWAYRSQ